MDCSSTVIFNVFGLLSTYTMVNIDDLDVQELYGAWFVVTVDT